MFGRDLKLVQSSSTLREFKILLIKLVGPPIIDVPESITALFIPLK